VTNSCRSFDRRRGRFPAGEGRRGQYHPENSPSVGFRSGEMRPCGQSFRRTVAIGRFGARVRAAARVAMVQRSVLLWPSNHDKLAPRHHRRPRARQPARRRRVQRLCHDNLRRSVPQTGRSVGSRVFRPKYRPPPLGVPQTSLNLEPYWTNAHWHVGWHVVLRRSS